MGEEVIAEGEGDVGGVDGQGEVETYGMALIQCVRSRKTSSLCEFPLPILGASKSKKRGTMERDVRA